ncbi:MAG: Transcription-repair coupling factor [uncultured Sphingosinicella sp.]|uniref:Transcription-repair-coupling factor n=1 Tax=uncultured Sphingosinicella sp. TaxID=478748 RepID=A0A6J4U183_9SPHN|nr:helicase-related protein [uncultured Sphingosinicella sp.]CAA9535729.1 MAG: Transcription-repair coupling factor [uncultured Sphingosinicella sp.]
MLADTAPDRAADADREPQVAPEPRDAAIGPTLARLLAAVENDDVLMIASTEQRGEALANAAASLTDALVLWCPPPDVLPGEPVPSSPAVAGKRFGALAALHHRGDRRVLFITDAASAAQKLPPPGAFAATMLAFRPGDAIDSEALPAELEAIGYFADERVDEPGEFAIRGGAIDLFPASADMPVRIHLDDHHVERIDVYDPVTQLGGEDALKLLELCPAAEPESGEAGATLFDHLPGAAVALDPEAEERRDRFVELAEDPAAKKKLAAGAHWRDALKGRTRIDLTETSEQPGKRFVQRKNPGRAFAEALEEARGRGDRFVIAGSARDIRFVACRMERRLGEAPRQIERWVDIARAEPGALLAVEAELERGWTEPGLMVVATADILGARAHAAAGPAANPLEQHVADFHIGDAVIHEDHGLGVLRGIETVTTGDAESDAIRLEYAGETQRLVPVEEADRLWRYGADADAVSLDRLNGSSWEKRRAEINETIAETARQLVALAAERAERTAPVLEPSVRDYERFSAGFPYSETADQVRAIQAVRDDLASGKPMDRLVVGDVGYGKTEVALRAAALAALAGKQVAIVAPTTVLVRQHIETFRRRFERLKIEVAGLSRLSSPAEARQVKKGLADGSIRVVIGTQMVAGKGVVYQDLALVVIDEEQRFGAADKAKLRALADDAHVLTLTATPIPRTLQTALVGLQGLSLITTPPARRLPIRTSVASWAPERVRPALLREKKRGGQSFVVVPRIEDMAPMADKLRALVPDLSIRQAHGKMPAAEIDEEMIRFASGDGDILLATNIIEAGLDIPRANTMLICRADRFGLAQLHQLRGRVGRGRVRGNLLLLTEADANIAPATLKRLRTLEALDQLGAGFAISARDLDLRGAGDILGEAQAGHMKLIGLGLYQHLLEQALRVARGEEVDEWMPELHLGAGGRLPESWIPEEEVRINLYVRLARLASGAELDAWADELEDRFGTLPPEALTLVAIARIRQLAREARIARIDAGPAAIALTPRRDFTGDALGLELKGTRLLLKERIEDEAERLERLRTLLESLAA